MRPKKREETSELFKVELKKIINRRHPLVKLSEEIFRISLGLILRG